VCDKSNRVGYGGQNTGQKINKLPKPSRRKNKKAYLGMSFTVF
jgi:hypothetical protein